MSVFTSVILSSNNWKVENQKIWGWICDVEGKLVDVVSQRALKDVGSRLIRGTLINSAVRCGDSTTRSLFALQRTL